MVATFIARSSALSGPRGQLFSTCSAYSAFACQATSLLLADYTRLALPLCIAVVPLSCIGLLSRSHRSYAYTALALCLISLNALFRPLFNLNEQFTLMPRMQQQVIHLENQNNYLTAQYIALIKQTAVSQYILKHDLNTTGRKDLVEEKELSEAITLNLHAHTQIENSQAATSGQIYLSTAYLEYGNRNFLDDYWIQYYQRSITSADNLIRANQQLIANINQIIANNNALIPPPPIVHFPLWVDQKTCVSGYSCIQLSWQQPFIDGWHNITTEPLSTTWFFWLSLLLVLPGMFVVLPRYDDNTQANLWKVSYRLLYAGPLSQLDDPAFPDQQREIWPPETSIVKITVTSTQFLRKKDAMGKDVPNLPYRFRGNYTEDELYGDAQDFLYLNLGLGTTVHDAFLAQKTDKKAQDSSTVSYDTTSGNIVVKVKPTVPIAPASVGQQWKLRKNTLARQFPIQCYVVVDSFAGTLDATTPIAAITQLQEERGSKRFIKLINILQSLLSFFYFIGFFMAPQLASYIFFTGFVYPPHLFELTLGWLITIFVFKTLEAIFTRIAIRRPNPLPFNPLVS